MKTSLRLTLLSLLILCTGLAGFDVDNLDKIERTMAVLTFNDTDNPDLPETPYNYRDFNFPEHVLFSEWGETDTSVVDFVTNEGSTLGRLLFYDQRLSALENISCASCHGQQFSFADDKAFSEGVSLPTKRNSMHLNDLGWTNRAGFFWDMSQTDLKEMIKLPLKDENEVGAEIPDVIAKLNDTEYYPELFMDAYGTTEITEDLITDAISQFISSMNTFDSKRDKVLSGKDVFSEEEMEGFHLFEQACGFCHFDGTSSGVFGVDIFEFPFIFSNGLPSNDDPGMGGWMGPEFNGLFKVPTLRNIEKTGPYMHDGRFETLEDVVQFYSEEVEPNEWTMMIPPEGFQFTEEQKSHLVAFLKTFTDESFLKDPKWSDPFKSGTTPVEDLFLDNNVLVSPNPFSNAARISFDNDNNELVKINLVNSAGQLMRTIETKEQEYLLEKEELASGIYFLDVIKAGKASSMKIIVQ